MGGAAAVAEDGDHGGAAGLVHKAAEAETRAEKATVRIVVRRGSSPNFVFCKRTGFLVFFSDCFCILIAKLEGSRYFNAMFESISPNHNQPDTTYYWSLLQEKIKHFINLAPFVFFVSSPVTVIARSGELTTPGVEQMELAVVSAAPACLPLLLLLLLLFLLLLLLLTSRLLCQDPSRRPATLSPCTSDEAESCARTERGGGCGARRWAQSEEIFFVNKKICVYKFVYFWSRKNMQICVTQNKKCTCAT